ncbi:MAG: hypothetical protein EOQ56_27905 [Mesorhizobium sp.]|nr:MAG: hypothetical protein EOQ56_27905 [Mesorhizobium sp.]
MNIEDGDELPLCVTFEEEHDDGDAWHLYLSVLPRVGDQLVLGPARKGLEHKVTRIVHFIGGASHRIIVKIERLP